MMRVPATVLEAMQQGRDDEPEGQHQQAKQGKVAAVTTGHRHRLSRRAPPRGGFSPQPCCHVRDPRGDHHPSWKPPCCRPLREAGRPHGPIRRRRRRCYGPVASSDVSGVRRAARPIRRALRVWSARAAPPPPPARATQRCCRVAPCAQRAASPRPRLRSGRATRRWSQAHAQRQATRWGALVAPAEEAPWEPERRDTRRTARRAARAAPARRGAAGSSGGSCS